MSFEPIDNDLPWDRPAFERHGFYKASLELLMQRKRPFFAYVHNKDIECQLGRPVAGIPPFKSIRAVMRHEMWDIDAGCPVFQPFADHSLRQKRDSFHRFTFCWGPV